MPDSHASLLIATAACATAGRARRAGCFKSNQMFVSSVMILTDEEWHGHA